MPGLALGGCRLVPASPQIPSTGTVLADSTFPGEKRPLAVDVTSRLRHMHVLGPTGTGKSTLLVQMAVSDLEAGHGLVLLDPKGDLVQAVLERVPEHRRRDVVVLDPADTSRPVGLNPLRSATGASAEVVVENL
jgi:type IV secretory pathway TraG/TraD family ATPase VirD4